MTNRWLSEAVGRSASYDQRWDQMAAEGQAVHGEADLVTALGPPRCSVLDAGCGTGRVAIELIRRGYAVTGVDVDPSMLSMARAKAPEGDWLLADLSQVELDRHFDVVVLAGNVMIFVTPGTEAAVLANLGGLLRPGGLLVAGFSLEPGRLNLATYDRHATAAGLELMDRFCTWERQPYAGGNYAVSAHRRLA